MATVLRGVRPAAMAAVSERERLKAHPHRAQAAVNHARALDREAKEKPATEEGVATPKTKKRGRK